MPTWLVEWINTPLIVIAVLAVAGALIGIGKWIGAVNADRGSFKEFMNEIREDIKKIFHRLPAPAVVGSSPLHLTDFGQAIADNFGAIEWVVQLAPRLVDEVRGKEPFEIDARCGEYVNDTWATAFWRPKVQKCSYEMGTGVDSVLSVLKVVLRDELFKLLKEEPPAP